MEHTAVQTGAAGELCRLLDAHTTYYTTGFSIDVGQEEDAWDRALRELGPAQAYDAMAKHICSRYEQTCGKPFLFSDGCVSYEIKYHMDAYMALRGHSGYHRHISTRLLPKVLIKSRCREIDVSARDALDLKQLIIFRYRKGIRDCYRDTAEDPFSRLSASPERAKLRRSLIGAGLCLLLLFCMHLCAFDLFGAAPWYLFAGVAALALAQGVLLSALGSWRLAALLGMLYAAAGGIKLLALAAELLWYAPRSVPLSALCILADAALALWCMYLRKKA